MMLAALIPEDESTFVIAATIASFADSATIGSHLRFSHRRLCHIPLCLMSRPPTIPITLPPGFSATDFGSRRPEMSSGSITTASSVFERELYPTA